MKRFKIFSILLCGIAAFAFTSCLNDDNDKGLTKEQKQQAYAQMNGNYTSKVVFYSKLAGVASAPENKLDTLPATMKFMNDSTMYFELPSKALVSLMTDTNLANAIVTQFPMISFTAAIGIYNVTPPAFFINPQPTQFNVHNADGSQTEVRVILANNFANSFGVYSVEKRTLGVNFVIAGAYRNGQLDTNLLKQGVPVLVLGKRN